MMLVMVTVSFHIYVMDGDIYDKTANLIGKTTVLCKHNARRSSYCNCAASCAGTIQSISIQCFKKQSNLQIYLSLFRLSITSSLLSALTASVEVFRIRVLATTNSKKRKTLRISRLLAYLCLVVSDIVKSSNISANFTLWRFRSGFQIVIVPL